MPLWGGSDAIWYGYFSWAANTPSQFDGGGSI